MSAQSIERELARYQDLLGYHVSIKTSSGAVHCYVTYQGKQIGNICLLSQWRGHTRCARKALRIIRDHQKAMRMLEGVT